MALRIAGSRLVETGFTGTRLLGFGLVSLASAPPADTTPPAITSSATFSVSEGATAVATLTADEAVSAWAISGGADAALFTLHPTTGALAFAAAPDFEAPADADGNNIYVVQVTATDAASNTSAPFAISVTVTDVAEGGGTAGVGAFLAAILLG